MIIENVTIEEHINTYYKDYSMYVLQSRGIPSKYDALSNVQRLILLNSPDKITPTLEIVGECFKAGYHHGDDSLSGAINKLARKFDNSCSLLHGSGFFGNGMASASAPRYTKCKINKEIKDLINKYAPINEYDFDHNCMYLNLDYPIGLCTSIVGIGVGYRSQILPRNFDEIKRYVNGENLDLKPYFEGFQGKIKKKDERSWLITSNISYSEKKNEIAIVDLPPMMRYDTFIEKMGQILLDYPGIFKVINNSKLGVDIVISIKKELTKEEVEKFIHKLKMISSISVSEDIVFVDEEGIIRYDTITDYLDDFKIMRNNSILKKMLYDHEELKFELDYNTIKKEYLEFFMTAGLKIKPYEKNFKFSIDDVTVNKFLEGKDKRMTDRLRQIPLFKLTSDEIKKCEEAIVEYKQKIKNLGNEISSFKKSNKFDVKSKGVSLLKSKVN